MLMMPALMAMMLLASNGACRQGRDHTPDAATPAMPLTPTSAPSDVRQVNKLIPGANVPFRVEFEMTSKGAAAGTVIWRQSLGARRLDFFLLAPTPRGGVAIAIKFHDGNFPGADFYCNWIPRDADLLSVDCTPDPHDAPAVSRELLPTIYYGLIDRRLPDRSVIGISAQCYAVEKSLAPVDGEICVEPTRHIPLYYASDSGTVLEASRYTTDAGAATFSSDLVLRLGAMSPTVLSSRSGLELP